MYLNINSKNRGKMTSAVGEVKLTKKVSKISYLGMKVYFMDYMKVIGFTV